MSCKTSNKNISNSTNRAQRIDTLITRVADYTGDGVLDTEIIHITGESINSPYSWKYDLWSNGQIIYHYEASYNSKSDSFFYDPRYVGGCTDYNSCKHRFFFEELGMLIIDSKHYADGIASHMSDNAFGAIGLHFIMDSCGITNRQEAEIILDSIATVINKNKPNLVSFLETPVQEGSIMIFVKRFNRFVPVYHE